MKVEERFEVEVGIDRVFAELNDVGSIGYCVAGVKEVSVLNDDESMWKIEQRFGFMARTFTLHAKVVSREPPRRIAFAATGQDVSLQGHVDLERQSAERTACDVVIDIDVAGPLAPLVDVFAKGPQQALIRETLQNIRTRVEGSGTAQQVPAAAASTPPRREGPLVRLAAWFRRVTKRGN